MNQISLINIDNDTTLDADAVIIGTGAGGATTAKCLTDAGLKVVMLEEGGYYPSPSFRGSIGSLMGQLYRDGGITPIMGRPAIAFGEGRCVGGTTVINGGAFWRTPGKLLSCWSKELGLPDIDEEALAPHFDILEKDFSVKVHKEPDANQASTLLAEGCEKLGWRYEDVPRGQIGCRNSNRCPTGCYNDAKQSMLVSYIPEAVKHGARLIANARAERVIIKGTRAVGVQAVVSGIHGQFHRLTVRSDAVFVCAGPMQTPFILHRSGVRSNVGKELRLHLNLKAVAIFPHDIDPAAGTITSKQIMEFEDRDVFICSTTFDPVYLSLALAPQAPAEAESVMSGWRRTGIYVVQIKADTTGRVNSFPFMDRPVPSYYLTKGDIANIRFAIEKLGEALLASGAQKVYLPIAGSNSITNMSELVKLTQGPLDPRSLDIISVHAMSSCSLGKSLNAFGQVKGIEQLFVNDASMLPGATGISPQMTIMAIVRRNVAAFLEKRRQT